MHAWVEFQEIVINTKSIHSRYFSILFMAVLAACRSTPTEPAIEHSETMLPATATIQPPTITPTETRLVAVLATAPPTFPLDSYIVIFRKDSNLYFQDGNHPPIQLTHDREISRSPILSDDNQKIVFTRGERSDDVFTDPNIYSVNSDGSKEQLLVTPEWLATFGDSMGVSNLSFKPRTHQLQFNVCESQESIPHCLASTFIVDTETGEIEESSKNYSYTSPDGKMALDLSSDYIDIVDINGKVIRENILPYKVTAPVPIAPDIQWLPDSSGLIVAIPVSEKLSVYAGNLNYSVWRYTIASDIATQILLEPTPVKTFAQCFGVISESPDGNWGLYNSVENKLYLWNINSGEVQLYDAEAGCSQPVWSSDNQHFIYGGMGFSKVLGAVDEPPIRIDGFHSPWWIDANHFSYAEAVDITTNPATFKIRVGEIHGQSILVYDLPKPYLIIRLKQE